MASAASITTRATASRLRADSGLHFTIGAIADRENITLPQIAKEQVATVNVAPDIAEKSVSTKYPIFYIYCDRVVNNLKEKFRTFSGTISMNVDVRVTHEHLGELDQRLQFYVDAVTAVLDANRGTWQQGMFYAGGYEVQFGTVKHGGKQFLQTAKVRFDVNLSSDE